MQKHQVNHEQLPYYTNEGEPWPKRTIKKKKPKNTIVSGDLTRPQPSQPARRVVQATASATVADAVDLNTAVDAPDDSSRTEESVSTVNVATDTLTTSTPEPAAPAPQGKPSATVPPRSPENTAPGITLPVLPKVSTETSKAEAVKDQTSEKSGEEPQTQTETSLGKQEAKPATKMLVKSWSDLLKPAATQPAAGAQTGANGTAATTEAGSGSQVLGVSGSGPQNNKTMAEVLGSFRVESSGKTAFFIEPRGLLNSGVDCYMNSVSSDSS